MGEEAGGVTNHEQAAALLVRWLRERAESLTIGRSDSDAISSTNHQLITVVIISVFPYNCIFDRLREISLYLGFRRFVIRAVYGSLRQSRLSYNRANGA